MSGIGPGDAVQCVKEVRLASTPPVNIYKDSIYFVEAFVEPFGQCGFCGNTDLFLRIKGLPQSVMFNGTIYRKVSACPCMFRPWPGPADEMLKNVDIDLDDDVKAPELEKV